MQVAIYGRVSTDEQAERQTIENQLRACRQYAAQHDFEVYAEYTDEGVSGTIPLEDRPAGARLFADAVEKKFSKVIVYRLDRLSRETLGALLALKRLEGLKAPVESVDERFDDSPSGTFHRTVMTAVAELEKNLIRQRTMAGRQRSVRGGKYLATHTPFGYLRTEDGQIEPDPDTAPIVRQIFAWALEGTGAIVIGQRLDAMGIKPPMVDHPKRKGKFPVWNFSTIYKILKAPRYIGETSYGGETMTCPPIIDKATFAQVAKHLSRRKAESPRNTKHEYLLQHLVWCRWCGARYSAATTRAGHQRYHCHQRRTFGPKAGHDDIKWFWTADALESRVKEGVARLIHDPERFLKEVNATVEGIRENIDAAAQRVATLQAQLADFEVQSERILSLHRRGLIDESQVDRQFAEIAKERRQAQEDLKIARRDEDEAASLTQALSWFQALAEGSAQRATRQPQTDKKPPAYGFVDEDTGDPAEPDFETWHRMIRQTVDRIWVENDGSITLEGPGQGHLMTLPPADDDGGDGGDDGPDDGVSVSKLNRRRGGGRGRGTP